MRLHVNIDLFISVNFLCTVSMCWSDSWFSISMTSKNTYTSSCSVCSCSPAAEVHDGKVQPFFFYFEREVEDYFPLTMETPSINNT